MNIKQEIVDSIQIIVDAAIRKICPIITFGICTSIQSTNKCIVQINNVDNIVYYFGGKPKINKRYPVFIPSGKMTLAFIIASETNTEGTTDYNELENRPSINNVLLSGNKTLSDLQINRIYVGQCSTDAAVSEKIIEIDDSQNFALETGSIIAIKYSVSNSASNVTLNINDSGAKQIWYSGSAYTGNSQAVTGYANRYTFYVYDGTYWVWITYGAYPTNTVPASYCSSGASTAAKTAAHTSYIATANTYTFVTIVNANTSKTALTLSINGQGAKPIYINGTASSSTNYTLPAGTYIVYYDGSNYHFRTDGQIPNLATVATSGSYNDLSNKPTIPSAVTETTVSGWGFTKNTGTYSKPSGGIPKTDLATDVQTSLEKADTALQSAPVTSVNGQTGTVTITNITGSAGSATNDGNGNNIANTYKLKSLGSKTFAAQDKDGTAIVGSANNAADASFYFGKTTPTDFESQWEITYRIKVYCANNSDYRQSATVRLFGTGAVRAGYETTNDIYSTSYRAAYYHNLYSIKSTGFANGYGNLIGVGLNNSANPTNTSYPRTIEVEILDTKNCVFSFFDYALKYANVAGTGSANFDGLTQWDFANNGHKPNDNNVDRIRLENGRVYAGAGGIMNYSLCCLDKDGKWQSLTTTSGTGNTKTINTNAKFKDEPVILYYNVNNTATNGNLVANTYGLFSVYPNLDLRYSTNTTTTAFAGNSPIYIECTFDSDGFWSPTINCITQTLRNGYYYIYLGNTYSTVYQLSLFAEHPVYYCEGTNLTKKQMSIASTIIKFTLNQTSVVASKTPSEMSALFTGDGYVLAKLYNSTNGIYETLEKITCNSTTITFSTIYQNTLGGGFTYKKVIGNIANNTWVYEIS